MSSLTQRYKCVQPCFLFVGEQFESNDACKLAKSLLLDTFRAATATEFNVMSLDHVMAVFATSDTELLIRHYSIKLKKSGTRVRRHPPLVAVVSVRTCRICAHALLCTLHAICIGRIHVHSMG